LFFKPKNNLLDTKSADTNLVEEIQKLYPATMFLSDLLAKVNRDKNAAFHLDSRMFYW